MFRKRKMWVFLVVVALLSTTFIISFDYGMKKFNNYKDNKVITDTLPDIGKVASSFSVGDSVSPKAKITLKTEYKKSGDIINSQQAAAEFIGKNKQSLEEAGYIVEGMSNEEVVIKKVVDTYPPNKYVVGLKDQYIAIFRTDDKGNMFIEDEKNDVTDIEVPTEGDYDLLMKGSKDFVFDTKEEALEKLGEYDS
jgi:ABC-type proline/glycine betaine transport system substrate-binding protein